MLGNMLVEENWVLQTASVKTPEENDVSSVRPRSDGLEVRYGGCGDVREMY